MSNIFKIVYNIRLGGKVGQRGFSLIETVIVLGLMTLLLAFAAPAMLGDFGGGPTTQFSLSSLDTSRVRRIFQVALNTPESCTESFKNLVVDPTAFNVEQSAPVVLRSHPPAGGGQGQILYEDGMKLQASTVESIRLILLGSMSGDLFFSKVRVVLKESHQSTEPNVQEFPLLLIVDTAASPPQVVECWKEITKINPISCLPGEVIIEIKADGTPVCGEAPPI